GREASDSPGSMRPMVAVQVSTVGYSPTQNRFGDYFGCAVDPSDDQTFWGAGEYAIGANTWQTWNFSFTVAPCCVAPVVATMSNSAVVCSTGFSSSLPSLISGTTPVTWSFVGPTPPGMTIDSGTGQVTWPSAVASATPYSITLQARNGCGSNSTTFS